MSFKENLLVYLLFFVIVAHLGGVGLDGVVNVDEDKEDGDEQSHPKSQLFQNPFSL
jgi:hypothetical protein